MNYSRFLIKSQSKCETGNCIPGSAHLKKIMIKDRKSIK